MKKSAYVMARMEQALKNDAENVLHDLGINTTQAITMLYKSIARNRKYPIELKIPNKKTLQSMQYTAKGKNLVHYKDIDSMFKDLGI